MRCHTNIPINEKENLMKKMNELSLRVLKLIPNTIYSRISVSPESDRNYDNIY